MHSPFDRFYTVNQDCLNTVAKHYIGTLLELSEMYTSDDRELEILENTIVEEVLNMGEVKDKIYQLLTHFPTNDNAEEYGTNLALWALGLENELDPDVEAGASELGFEHKYVVINDEGKPFWDY